MNKTASFKIEKEPLLTALKQLQRIEKSSKKKRSTVEITILKGYIQLVTAGVRLNIHADTDGSAKFTILLWYIADVVNTEKDFYLDFSLNENRLRLRGFKFDVATTFFENDRILRSINLPVNYKYLDIVELYLSEKFTEEEIAFNKLDKIVLESVEKLKKDIDKVSSIMREYRFTRNEVEALLLNKIKAE